MTDQLRYDVPSDRESTDVEEYRFEPIKGYPMLHWRGKRPFTSTRYYPAQLKEVHGPEVDGWRNKIYWGDNLQVMSHLLKEYRNSIDLVYIDPPYDSNAEYKKQVRVRSKSTAGDYTAFEEKQYADLWANDEYLQFMYERIALIRELLSGTGSLFLHVDWRQADYLKIILDEVFGPSRYVAGIRWRRMTPSGYKGLKKPGRAHDSILWYSKSASFHYNTRYIPYSDSYIKSHYNQVDDLGRRYRSHWLGTTTQETIDKYLESGRVVQREDGSYEKRLFLDEQPGTPIDDMWTDIFPVNSQAHEDTKYPTQKPEALLERIVQAATNPGDLVFDCFMGSGTTQVVAMKLGRRFVGADINAGAIQTATGRLLQAAQELAGQQEGMQPDLGIEASSASDGGHDELRPRFVGFEVLNVNRYDVFRNPVEARDLLIDALELNRISPGAVFDGEKDGRLVKIMPVNRIATRQDLNELINGFDYKSFARRHEQSPNQPVERVTLVCMGHEPDLAAVLENEVKPYKIDIEVVDILRQRQDLQFKRDSEALIVVCGGDLVIKAFYPMNLLGKLSLQKESVEDWRELVESVMVDWNYDGAVLQPGVVDIPEKQEWVMGRYAIPEDAGTVRVKITDLLSESLEQEVRLG